MRGFEVINKQVVLELQYEYFTSQMNIGSRKWSSLAENITKRKTTFNCVLPDEIHTTTKVFLVKKSNLDLIKSLDPTTSLQEIWGHRNHVKTPPQGIISKMGMWDIL